MGRARVSRAASPGTQRSNTVCMVITGSGAGRGAGWCTARQTCSSRSRLRVAADRTGPPAMLAVSHHSWNVDWNTVLLAGASLWQARGQQ